MSKRDSHPENNQSPTLTGMGDRTEPGAPPDATPPYVSPARRSSPPVDPAADLAASLLKDLARTSLPSVGVSETSGQNAAAYAVSARRPPRAQEDKTLEPAVVVNMTEPFPIALPLPSPLPPRREDATLVMEPRRVTDPNDPRARKTMPAMRMAHAVPPPSMAPTPLPLTPRPMHKTVLGPRQQRRQVLLGIMSVIGIATLVAIGILAFAPRARTAASSAATSELTAATTEAVTITTAASPPVLLSAPAESPAVLATAPPPPVTAAAAPPPPAPPRATARVAPSSRSAPPSKPATPKPANTFEEPDRTF